jgi:hypothetical protein
VDSPPEAFGPTTQAKEVSVSELEDGRVDAELFFDVGAQPDQVSAVRAAVASSPFVERFAFVVERQALHEFRKIFRRYPDVTRGISGRHPSLPPRLLSARSVARDALTRNHLSEGLRAQGPTGIELPHHRDRRDMNVAAGSSARRA